MWVKSDQEITDSDLEKIIAWYNAYVKDSKPLDYILWHVEFFGVKFFVNQHTIIPRPETEYMISAVTEYCKKYFADKSDNILMDIWTWCGVLWISVLLQNLNTFQTVFLTDYSQDAILVAKQNYDNLIKSDHFDIKFIRSDLVNFVDSYSSIIWDKNIILLWNLPYIPDQTHDDNNPDSVKKREPRMAFVGGEDWLIYYYKMFDQLIDFKLHKVVMFLEMMTRQVDILRSKYSEIFIFEEVKTFHFNIRIVKVWFK
jgi:release factor glutamine methyltransferase